MITEFGIETEQLKENRIIGEVVCHNSDVAFEGKGNILFADGSVSLRDSTIRFCGDNAVLYLSNSKKDYKVNLALWRETVMYIGGDNYFNKPLNAIVSERKIIIIGSNGEFSFGIWMRTADPHLIYNIESKRRINPSKSIVIGDHVWLGQNATILKACRIGSGSIVSANCVLAGKDVESNAIIAGNPGKIIKRGIFYLGNSVHNYTASRTKKSMIHRGDEYIFSSDENCIDINEIDDALADRTPEEKLEIIQTRLAGNTQKNRFYVPPAKMKTSFFSRLRK